MSDVQAVRAGVHALTSTEPPARAASMPVVSTMGTQFARACACSPTHVHAYAVCCVDVDHDVADPGSFRARRRRRVVDARKQTRKCAHTDVDGIGSNRVASMSASVAKCALRVRTHISTIDILVVLVAQHRGDQQQSNKISRPSRCRDVEAVRARAGRARSPTRTRVRTGCQAISQPDVEGNRLARAFRP